MSGNLPKQYLQLEDKSIILRTLETFAVCDEVKEIVVVVSHEYLNYCNKILFNFINEYKNITIVVGGNTRQKSVFNGLKAVSSLCDIVLIHDAVRPFVTIKNIKDTINGAIKTGNCVLGVKCKDTIKICNEKNEVIETPNRDTLWSIQTPQAFRFSLIFDAHKKAIEDDYFGTDDCVLIERLGNKVIIAEGSYFNIKITTKEDMILGEFILKYT